MDIRPGLNINIIVSIDHMREVVDVKNSMVHDVEGKRIIAAQTDPPISRTNLGKELFVTFLEKGRSGPARYGFIAKVVDFVKDYELKSSQKVQAVIMQQTGDIEEYNLRMFYRLEPPSECGIEISMEGRRVHLLDISIGGAKFSHEKIHPFQPNETVKMLIDVAGNKTQIEAMVLRVWEPESEKMRKTLAYASVQFLDIDAQLKNTLARKIRDIERDMRYNEVYVKK